MSNQGILIVEDDVDLRTIYELILKRSGYSVWLAKNGQEGLEQVMACQPQLVLLDIFMPIMDGKAFLQKIDLPNHQDMKVVVCSNTSDTELMDEMLQLGADQVVMKSSLAPADLTALVEPYMA